MENNYFKQLNDINVNDKTEDKNGLTYLSWAWAWGEVKKRFPDANYKIYENKDEWNYFTDGKTCWVKTGVTINEIEHIEELPVMDFRNKSILAENVTSFDVNKSIQRSLTKACARHGLGLYIYAGEDLPESENEVDKNKTVSKPAVKEELPKELEQVEVGNQFGSAKFKSGKYSGRTISEVYKTDRNYLDWAKDNYPEQTIKSYINEYLKDELPF